MAALAGAASAEEEIESSSPLHPAEETNGKHDVIRVPHRLRLLATSLSMAMIVMIMAGLFLVAAPTVRLIESLICVRYYREHNPSKIIGGDVPEKFCKVDAIQDELGIIQGYTALFSSIPGLLLAVPYGVLADKYGRRNILVLTLIGTSLSYGWGLFVGWFQLAPRLMWLGSAFFVIGGGGQMIAALIMMIIADVTPEDERSTVFFRLQGTVLFAEVIAPPIGSILMSKDIWIPLWIGVVTHLLTIVIALFMPETRTLNAPPLPRTPSSESLLDSSSSTSSTSAPKHKHVNGLREIIKMLVGDLRITFLVITFLITTIGRLYLVLILQYVSKRYDWSLAQSSLLLSVRAGANMLLLLWLLPATARFFKSRFELSTRSTDSWTARLSSVFLTLGFFGIAVAPNPGVLIFSLVVFTFGSGLPGAVRSLVTTMVKPSHIGVLYTSIALVDTAAGTVAGPTMSGMFSWGLKMGKQWSGMAFLFAAVLHMFVIAIVFLVKVPEGQGYERVEVDEEE